MEEKNEKSPSRSLKKNEDLQLDQKKNILAWSMYDWANSAFATTIMAGFFPVFLGAYWAPEGIVDSAQRTFVLCA